MRPAHTVVLALVLVACGPSLRRSQRASSYFEQCYAADIDPHVPDAERRACWMAWKRDYQIGASPERLDYVRERLAMLDPDRAAAIALATGDDAAPEMLDTTETSTEVATSATPTSEPRDPPTPPQPSEAAPPDGTLADRIRDERHARAHERHLHRGIVEPSTLTPRCPCQTEWTTCTAACLADDAGCIGACRREHVLCSRSCY
jgi:hypothetical protein